MCGGLEASKKINNLGGRISRGVGKMVRNLNSSAIHYSMFIKQAYMVVRM